MFIKKFTSGPIATNTYVVVSSLTREAFIIDAAPESFELVYDYLVTDGLKYKAILLTHSHWDHIADVSKIKEKFEIPVYVHALDAPNLQNPGADGLPCPLNFPQIKPDFLLEEGALLNLGNLTFQIIYTPGHSIGSVCFYEKNQHVLFSGDTLFQGSIGNISFPTSSPNLMWSSLAKLAQLDPNTRVFPGHGSLTTIKQEHWLANAQEYFG